MACCVIGGAGGIGQALCLLLKMDSLVSDLRVLDLVGAPGVAADLSHIDSPASVSGFGLTVGQKEKLEKEEQEQVQGAATAKALTGAEIVVITAGVPRKPGMNRQDLFAVNASLTRLNADKIATYCPSAIVCVVTNPVNSTVPIMAAQLSKRGVYNPRRLFGVTSLDLMRARTFVAEIVSSSASILSSEVHVPVVGGHAGTSIVPLLSQTSPASVKDALFAATSVEQRQDLVIRVQTAGTEVVQAKDGGGSATLSMAKTGADFVFSLLRAMRGEEGVVEYAYVDNDLMPQSCRFFSTPLELGRQGWVRNLGLGTLDATEQLLVDAAVKEVQPSIVAGLDFVSQEVKCRL